MKPVVWRWVAAALLLASGSSTAFYAWQSATEPAPEDWVAMAETLAARVQPDERVTVVPAWAHRLRERSGDLPLLEVPRRDFAAALRPWHQGVYVVGLYGRGADTAALFGSTTQVASHGGLTLHHALPPSFRPLVADLREHFGDAAVSVGGANCRRKGDRAICARGSWAWVGPHLSEVGRAPFACIWAHPHDKKPLRIVFTELPGAAQLHLEAGLADYVSWQAKVDNPGTVTLRAQLRSQTGEGNLELRVGPEHTRHRVIETLDLTALGDGPLEAELEITADRHRFRHLCFAARLLGPETTR